MELTNRCRNNCVHCSCGEKQKLEELSLFQIVFAINKLNPSKIVLSGGEPFLYPKLSEVISLIKGRGIRLAINTSGNFDASNVPKNILDVDEFYVSFFCHENERITRVTWNNELPFLFKMNGKKIWINTILFEERQINEIAYTAFYIEIPVHVMRLVKHGNATSLRVPSTAEQLSLAKRLLDQLDPSLIESRVPDFLVEDGYDPTVVASSLDEIKRKMKKVHPLSRISHSLIEGICRANEKRTLLPSGRIIGCVAGRGRNEALDARKVCT